VVAEPRNHDLRAHAAHPQDVDLRLGDANGGGVPGGAGALPGDPPRQRHDVGGEPRVGRHRQAQAVAPRVAGDGGLAGRGARAGAARRIGAVGGMDRCARHAGSRCASGAPLSTRANSLSTGAADKSRLFAMQASCVSCVFSHRSGTGRGV
jgi:hypothetical protein